MILPFEALHLVIKLGSVVLASTHVEDSIVVPMLIFQKSHYLRHELDQKPITSVMQFLYIFSIPLAGNDIARILSVM